MSVVIVVPAPMAAVTRTAGALTAVSRAEVFSQRRDSHVDLLRETLSDRGRANSTVSMQGERTGVPLQGSASSVRQVPLSLDALDAIILSDSSAEELDKLRRAGARIIENTLIQGTEPVARATATAAVPSEGELWHVGHVGARRLHAQGLTGKGVLLGVLDTGVDPNHPDLIGRVAHFSEFSQTGNMTGSLARDHADHGTHVCGTIAGRHCGIAPDARLAVAAGLTTRGTNGLMSGYVAQTLGGLNWLLQTEFGGEYVAAVNLSFGTTPYDDYLYDLLRNACEVQGVLVAAAIGNKGRGGTGHHGSPGNYDIVLGVGATDTNDVIAPFSDHGPVQRHGGRMKPDLSAPGVGIVSTLPGALYGSMDGTSMATPIVVGASALLAERDRGLLAQPGLLEAEVRRQVRQLPAQPAAGSGVLALR